VRPLKPHRPFNLADYQNKDSDFAHLSLMDLLEARDLYHQHLLCHPHVIATGISRYRIRSDDSWPNDPKQRHGTGVRRLDNSEVRPYSWPCILVFVDEWQDPASFASHPDEMVPKTLYLPNGTKVPVCVVEAPSESTADTAARNIRYPLNNIGSGHPIIAEVQGRDYAATVACLVTDGHKVYALTNRHVTGETGEVVWSELGGNRERVGTSSSKQFGRLPFTALYPNFPGKDTYVNADIGLIDLDNLDKWTVKLHDGSVAGPMADFSSANISLSLVGCQVCGTGAAGGRMAGEIQALFYRYKANSGFDYVADLFIGPRTSREEPGKGSKRASLTTLPGDSGSLWLLEPTPEATERNARKPANHKKSQQPGESKYLPLAVQWGRNMLYSTESGPPQSFALATLMSRVCALLEVDLVRDWNLDQPDTWGSIGHFSIAARTQVALSNDFTVLKGLMEKNARIISHDDQTILNSDFKGMGSEAFVPMADVPDFFWKPRVGKQGHTRPFEGPNHFADMDQPGPGGKSLLDLTEDDAFIDPDKWESFYSSVTDMLSGKPISAEHRGLLPFRVWQIFDAMVDFAGQGLAKEFVCAAGVLTHYVGDACQPLHISYLHDGDPLRPYEYTYSKGKKAGQSELRPLGQGVHSAYEDTMVNDNRAAILDGLTQTPTTNSGERLRSGFEAAKATIALMRATFELIPPADLVQFYIDHGSNAHKASGALWQRYGQRTVQVMQNGTHLLARLWESAWAVGNGDRKIKKAIPIDPDEAMDLVANPQFLPSTTINKIGSLLASKPG
jgi:hypothetical protein